MTTKVPRKRKSATARKLRVLPAVIKAKVDKAAARSNGIDPDTVTMPAPYDPLDPPKRTAPGRPTSYTEKLGAEICELVAMRVPLAHICKMPGMPNERTVYRWKRDTEQFCLNYARAREHRADARSDRIDEICEALRAGKLDPNAARVLIDAEKWQAGKEQPRRYGEKLEVEAKTGLVVVQLTAEDLAL
jgi:hypothetical protein